MQIGALLATVRAPLDWPAAQWAALAAAQAFEAGNLEEAARLAVRGMDCNPQNAQTAFVGRVIERVWNSAPLPERPGARHDSMQK
jgi:hypothetical protein